MMRRLLPTMVLVLATAACSSGATMVSETTRFDSAPTSITERTYPTTGPEVAAVPDLISVSAPPRLASHLFLPVGEKRSIAGLGELLEIIPFDGAEPVAVEGDVLTAAGNGVSCLRFRYREVPGENGVQTMCVVAFDETGDCAGHEPLQLDLNTFLEPVDAPFGNADALLGRSLFAACVTSDGAFRLQQPAVDPPELYFAIVDALGDGPYSLGDDEFAAQRNGSVTTYGGTELHPRWMVTVSREVSNIEWMPDGTFAVNAEDCSQVPSCTDDPVVVRAGDVFRTSIGVGPDQLQALMDSAVPAVLDAFVTPRLGIPWNEITVVHPDAVAQVFNRLAILEISGELLGEWDGQYRLREKGVLIGYWQPWFVERKLTGYCYPDAAERAKCEQIDAAISAYEGARIAGWRESGFRLWQAGFLGVDGGNLQADRRPHWSAFEGVMAGIGAQDLSGLDLRQVYAEAVRDYAAEVGTTTPVMLFLTGGPIAAQTTGIFCEADICASDFIGAYEMAEGTLAAALEVLTTEQFRGFGVATFEGAHFDIRNPYEDFGFPLNRVGETGYNHPILNVWRAS